MPVIDPENVLAAHIGNGAIFIRCDRAILDVSGYEAHVSASADGTFYRYGDSGKGINVFIIYGIPVLDQNIYIKIRAYTIVDSVKTFSNFVNAKRGTLVKPTISMRLRAVVGSVIPAGAIFSALASYDRVSAFQTEEEIVF